MKGLPLILFKSVIISIVVSIAANCIYYAFITRSGNHDYGQAVPLIMERTFFLGIIIGVMSLPMLFLYHPDYWNSITGRLLLYFSGTILFIISVFYISSKPVTQTADLLTGTVFFITHCVFYYRLTRKKITGSTYTTRK